MVQWTQKAPRPPFSRCDARPDTLDLRLTAIRFGYAMSHQTMTASINKTYAPPLLEMPVVVRDGAAVWRIQPPWRERIMGQGAPDWFDLGADPNAVAVKRGDGRTTWQVAIENQTVFAKEVTAVSWIARWKHRFLGGAPMREWGILLEAQRRGVCVVEPIALGESRAHDGRTVLLTKAVDGAVPLTEHWRRQVQSLPASGRCVAAAELIGLLAELFADAHEKGFIHADAHPNNILIHTDSAQVWKATFVDVHGAKLMRRPVNLRQSLRSLAQLDQFFHRVATRSERLRFLGRYFAHRPAFMSSWGDATPRRDSLRLLRLASSNHAARLAFTRDRRLRRNGAYFSTFSLDNGWRVTAVLRLERRHVFAEAGVPDRDEAAWRSLLARAIDPLGEMQDCEIHLRNDGLSFETCRVAGITAQISATLVGSAQRSRFERCHMERHRDVKNELLLAYAEHRRGGLVDAVALIRPLREPTECGVGVAEETHGERE